MGGNKFKPLPNEIDPTILKKFTVGTVEGTTDPLLWLCFCDIAPIERFLDGSKDILLGAKGAGKSAVFTLIEQRKIAFQNPGSLSQIIITIDQQLEYNKLKALVLKHLRSDIEEDDIRFRFLWEIYVLYRICIEVKGAGLLDDGEDRLVKEVNDFVAIFSGEGKEPTLMQLLASTKRTFGVKLNAANPAFPVPDVYVSMEPSANQEHLEAKPLAIDIAYVKVEVNKLLRRRKNVVYLLIDNIDDFVAREEYKIQKLLLQGLLQATKDYTQLSNIKIKLFLRTDLYSKLDFSQLGGIDKVSPRTVELKWTPASIREFIAQRILYNVVRQLQIRQFTFSSDSGEIRMDIKEHEESYFRNTFVRLLSRFYALLTSQKYRLQMDA